MGRHKTISDDAVLRVARDLFGVRGHTVTTREIAEAAGISEAILYQREALEVGTRLTGPAIIEQFDATTVIPAGWSGRVDSFRNLILERKS